MKLWIRSQDKSGFIEADNLYATEGRIVLIARLGGRVIIGKYSSQKRALEVLDEIQEKIEKSNKNTLKINTLVDSNTLVRIKKNYEQLNDEKISIYNDDIELLNNNKNIVIYEMPVE